jgi:hypothetical protein
VDLDEDVKPDISNLGSTSRAGEEEGDDEMRVKDFKPSVDVTFKGKSELNRDSILMYRIRYFLPPACAYYRTIPRPST